MKPKVLFQGEDKYIDIEVNNDPTSATEIEWILDTDTQIKKTLSGGSISGATAASGSTKAKFTVQIDAADTATVIAGPYKMQGRITISGRKSQITFKPNFLRIKTSTLENQRLSGNDYGG